MFFLLILWPVAEIIVAVEVARAIGVVLMLALVILGWPLGAWAIRSQGAIVWRHLAEAVGAQRTPTREVLDGALVLIGGTLIMVPGFITDVIGLLCVLPPTRSLIRGAFLRSLQGRMMAGAFRVTGVRVYDVDSTARDVDVDPPPSLQR